MKSCAATATSCFDKLSKRETFHLVLSLSKSEVGTGLKVGAGAHFTAPQCELA